MTTINVSNIFELLVQLYTMLFDALDELIQFLFREVNMFWLRDLIEAINDTMDANIPIPPENLSLIVVIMGGGLVAFVVITVFRWLVLK